MKTFALILTGLFTLAGLALILPAAMFWDAYQIQAGLGNFQPLTNATYNMGDGLACLAMAWLIMKFAK